ncbi:MAG: hypothetical protein ACREIF_05960 [Chthoniobacterales bacterium]
MLALEKDITLSIVGGCRSSLALHHAVLSNPYTIRPGAMMSLGALVILGKLRQSGTLAGGRRALLDSVKYSLSNA